MLYLLEVTYTNDKEVPALYPTAGAEPFTDETALTAEFDTKMGAAIKAEAYKAELLVAFDSAGRIIAAGYHSKDESVALSPRLLSVTVTDDGENADQTKENDLNALEGDFYSKRGVAKKNNSVNAIALIGVDGKKVTITNHWVRPIEYVKPQEQGE